MAAQPIRVLLVEDNPGDARLIEWMLRDSGEARFELTGCDRLAAARDKLGEDGGFGVVLLDLSLPDGQGLDTFRRLHADYPLVPVVVLTGLADETVALQAVQEGAQDYLVKGQVLDRHLVHALRYAVGRHQSRRRQEESLGVSPQDLEVMRQVQRRLLPQRAPDCLGLDVHGVSVPATTVGGDFFDYLEPGDGKLVVAVGDVMGHGLGPALLMASTRAYLRAFAESEPDLGRVLERTNRALAADMAGQFVTLLAAAVDGRRRLLRYSSAGHPPGFVLDPRGRPRAQLYSTGLPLGVFPDGDFPAVEVPLEAGETVLLWTDGVTEPAEPGGEQFGTDRLLAVARDCVGRPPDALVRSLHDAVRAFAPGPQQDDLTAIALRLAD